MNQQERITGTVERIVFKNDETDYGDLVHADCFLNCIDIIGLMGAEDLIQERLERE